MPRPNQSAEAIAYKHGYAFLAEPRYPADFPHFDYVNPDAPKGGAMRRHGTGSWDSFNPAALRAAQVVAGLSMAAPHANYLHDSLLAEAADEPAAWYGRLAEGVAVAEDGAWIAFKIRDGARWHDGQPAHHRGRGLYLPRLPRRSHRHSQHAVAAHRGHRGVE